MPVRVGKQMWTLKIDKGFQDLIRPLFKNEYLQLEANIMADGCREPISVWNDVIVDGHNRYKICTEHGIPFAVEEKTFSCREEAIAWICANQLGRRNLTEESRKYLIGKQYESEKIISRRQAIYQGSSEDADKLPYEPFNPSVDRRIRAIEEIRKKEPQMATKILSGRYKISHKGVLALARRSPEEIRNLNMRLEKTQYPFARYQTTRREIQGAATNANTRPEQNRQPSIKDMPVFDPDAEVVGLTLTIPSWSSSIDRIVHSNLDNVSEGARVKLCNALIELQDAIETMISVIKEEA